MDDRLINIFKNVFLDLADKGSQTVSKASRDEVETWDSMNHFVLISSIEEEFSISLSDVEILEINSFVTAKRIIESKTG